VQVQQLLFSQGFGNRRACAALVHAGAVRVHGRTADDPAEDVPVHKGMTFEVHGQPWPYHASALLLLHKPAGTECSRAPRDHPGVLSLLPAPLRTRGVQPVGRLDADTTGLLLLTDDGALLHRLTSPKKRVAKVYRAGVRHALDETQLARLHAGVVLHDDPEPVRAEAAEALDAHTLRLVITAGKYHQVKRMLAAVGNRVESLHRSAFGGLELPADLAPGQWRWLGEAERQQLLGGAG
jgi:16S rRNA pseudouridine516 synthase